MSYENDKEFRRKLKSLKKELCCLQDQVTAIQNDLVHNVDTIEFNTSYVPTGDEPQGTMYWNSEKTTLELVINGFTYSFGGSLFLEVTNDSGAIIPKGTVVMATDTNGVSGNILVEPYDITVPVRYIVGVAVEDIAIGEHGVASPFIKLRGIDTSSWAEGTVLYVADNGQLTDVEPTTGVYNAIAIVIASHAVQGSIFVRFTPIDEFNIVAHATTHQQGGTDPIKLDDLATPDDNTDLNATTLRHGLLPKLSGVSTEFLAGDGSWATPSGGGGGGLEESMVLKLVDQTKSEDAVLADDNELFIGLDANSKYMFDIVLYHYVASAPDMNLTIAAPSGATGQFFFDQDSNQALIYSFGTVNTVLGLNANRAWHLTGYVATTTAGNLSVQWAQAVSGVGNVTIYAGSSIRLTKLS